MLEKLKQYKESMYEAMDQAENLGASAVKISFDHDEGISASYESGRLKYADASESMAFAILVIVDGKFGKAAANQPETLNEMVKRAVKLAETGAPAHFATFPKPAMKYDNIQSFDQVTAELPRRRIVEDCGRLVDAIKSLHPSMVVNAAGSRIVGESLTINNAGLYDEFQESSWKIGAGFSKTTGTDMLFCSAARGWGKLDEHYDLDYIVNTVTENYKNASRTARLPDGKYPLLLPPKFVQRFLAPVKMGLNGFNVYLGTSPLKDKLGQTPFDSSFSLYDDPIIDFCDGSSNMDDCGIPTKKRFLVEKGRINLFLYDYDTACLVNAAPTGNSACAPYNPILIPGEINSKELLKSIKRGIFIDQLLGFGQSNFANGDFSANVQLGYVIENGEIVGRLKDTMIAGNIFEMLSKPIIASSDVDKCHLNPYMLFSEVNLFSK